MLEAKRPKSHIETQRVAWRFLWPVFVLFNICIKEVTTPIEREDFTFSDL